MAIYSRWDVFIGQAWEDSSSDFAYQIPTAANDFTSRAISIDVDIAIDIGRVGTSSATITLDNSDGAFTPFGGGTYEDFDWLAQLVFVRARTGTNPASLTPQHPLFIGVVSDVRYEDDGFTSRVTIECDDLLSAQFSRALLTQDWDNFLSPYTLFNIWETINISYSPDLPKYGLAGSDNYFVGFWTADANGDNTFQPQEFSADEGTPIGDIFQDLTVAEHGIMFPPSAFFFIQPAGVGNVEWHGVCVARDWLWGSQAGYTPKSMTFVETTPTGSELPFKSPTVGFSIDNLTNSAYCTIAGAGAVTQSAENTTSRDSYGTRSADFSSLTFGYDADALELAQHLVARYDGVDFGVTGLSITGGMIQSRCADAALSTVSNMLQAATTGGLRGTPLDFSDDSLSGALFQPTYVSFTGAGGVDLSSRITFFHASYKITPEDWELTLSDGRPAVSSFGFVIGETNYGVLGTNKVA